MVSNACPHWLSLCILFLLLLNSSRIVFLLEIQVVYVTSKPITYTYFPESKRDGSFYHMENCFLNQSMAHVISLNWHITFIGVHITEGKETYRVYRRLCSVDSWCNNMSFLKYSTNLNSILIYFTHNSVCLSFDIRILITPLLSSNSSVPVVELVC